MKFSMVKVADSLGMELLSVRSQLCHLLDDDQGAYGAKNTASVDFSDRAIHIQTHRNFTTEDRDSVCKYLCEKMKEQEEKQLKKLHLMHAALSLESQSKGSDAHAAIQPSLKAMTEKYFSNEGLERSYLEKYKIPVLPLIEEVTPEQKNRVKNSVRSFIQANRKEKFTGRSIARIFHGIQSPCYPARTWGHKSMYWRSYIAVNFDTLCEIATEICGQ
jgi:ATP-dependent DNA helicase Q4